MTRNPREPMILPWGGVHRVLGKRGTGAFAYCSRFPHVEAAIAPPIRLNGLGDIWNTRLQGAPFLEKYRGPTVIRITNLQLERTSNSSNNSTFLRLRLPI